ncbi:signal peptidase II [Pseudobdellovibrio exovorus]|uniref:signal peptidase II n=1 Tax=Pseudobdellovibrio exovorus TaxID=453816 RepID=UPI001F40A0F1|nr:signal peptidase II [Pseudobdellovibrio exovorus]
MSSYLQRKYLLLMGVTGLMVSLDQVTKLLVHTQMELHQSIPVIQNFFHITYVRNFGAAFGFLSQAPTAFRDIFFLAVPPIACLIILFILKGVDDKDTKQTLALSSVFAGAVGNYLDRLHFGFVVDFFDFHYGKLSWPAFNIADMAIVGGVCFLLYFMFKESSASKA